jgi:superfamily II DNA or RNA helicase
MDNRKMKIIDHLTPSLRRRLVSHLPLLELDADHQVAQRGNALYQDGNVLRIELLPDEDEDEDEDIAANGIVLASSGRKRYSVSLYISMDMEEVGGICSCPYGPSHWGEECKHVVAVWKAVQGNLRKNAIRWEEPSPEEDENESLSSPPFSLHLQRWVDTFSNLLPSPQKEERSPTHILVFVLNIQGIGSYSNTNTAWLNPLLLELTEQDHLPSERELELPWGSRAAEYKHISVIGGDQLPEKVAQFYEEAPPHARWQDYVVLSQEDEEYACEYHLSHKAPQLKPEQFLEYLKAGRIIHNSNRGAVYMKWEEPLPGRVFLKPMKSGVCAPRLEIVKPEKGTAPRTFEFGERYFYISRADNTVGEVTFEHPHRVIHHFLSAPQFDRENLPLVQAALAQTFPEEKPLLTGTPTKLIHGKNPRPILTLKASPYFSSTHQRYHMRTRDRFSTTPLSVIELGFQYGDIYVPWTKRSKANFKKKHPVTEEPIELIRDRDQENLFLDAFLERGFLRVTDAEDLQWKASDEDSNCFWFSDMVFDRGAFWAQFFDNDKPYFESLGWRVETSPTFPFAVTEPGAWYLELSEEESEWMYCEVGVVVNGERHSLIPILGALLGEPNGVAGLPQLQKEGKEYYVVLVAHTQIALEKERVHRIVSSLLEIYNHDKKSPKLQIHPTRARQILDLTQEGAIQWEAPPGLQSLEKAREKYLSQSEKITPPRALNAHLREYQTEGLQWLLFLRKIGCGGILADDMGLGKTIQVLAYLLACKQRRKLTHPALILSPSSVASNWIAEATRFTPTLKSCLLTGPDRKEHFSALQEYDLIVSTYPLIRRDIAHLRQHQFSVLACDEAQNLKNPDAQTTKLVSHLSVEQTLHLTGTPMENNLRELWSLFNILSPGYLGSKKAFGEWFDRPIHRCGDTAQLELLQKKIHPFILRRTKAEVLKDLPERLEVPVRLEMTARQKDYYETVRSSTAKGIKKLVEEKGMGQSHIEFLTALLRLRQACCHPALAEPEGNWKDADSVKLTYLKEQIPELLNGNHRILIFSQFTTMLDHISNALQKMKIDFTTLTGKTRNRDRCIKQFKSGEVAVFLISLKAGGVGLNLTEADTVFLCDPWWNPAVENQAIDRAYRIGQKKDVSVFRLYTSGTIEEKIEELQQSKQKLFDDTLKGSGGALSQKFTEEDVHFLLAG